MLASSSKFLSTVMVWCFWSHFYYSVWNPLVKFTRYLSFVTWLCVFWPSITLTVFFCSDMKLESAASSSLEDRVRRKIHSIQRTPASFNNFMKRWRHHTFTTLCMKWLKKPGKCIPPTPLSVCLKDLGWMVWWESVKQRTTWLLLWKADSTVVK